MKPLDIVNLCYIWLKTYPLLYRTWSGGPEKGFAEVKVNYGHERIPEPHELVFGGLVKLQDLGQEYPSSVNEPNILYLVSSALPYYPIRLVKMARRAGAKLVLNQNGVAYKGWFGDGWERQNKNNAALHAEADYVFYQSEFCKISAERFLGHKIASSASEILYNPVDTSVFCPDGQGFGQNGNVSLLLAGSHWTTYRVFTALETLQKVLTQINNVYLTIAGRFCWCEDEKIAEEDVLNYARQLGVVDNIRLAGPYSQEKAPELLNKSSILLHTKYNDPCPRLVVEAMSCGLPIVYSATGGVSELVGEEAGIGVAGPLDWEKDHPPGPEPLATAVLKVIAGMERFTYGARQRAVRKFGVEHWLSRHRSVFNNLLKKS